MFNTPRAHRWITVPAVVVLFAAFVASGLPHLALAMVPPVIALPFIAHAAIRRTDGAIALGLNATRVIGWLMAAWGLITTVVFFPFGLIVLAAAILMLVTAGTQYDERRLAALTILTGALAGVGTVLLMWIGVDPVLHTLAAAALMIGGLGWLVEARRAPLTTEDFPGMTAAGITTAGRTS